MALKAGKSRWRTSACGCRAGCYLERYPQGKQVRVTAVGDLSIHLFGRQKNTLIVHNSAIWPSSVNTFAWSLILNCLRAKVKSCLFLFVRWPFEQTSNGRRSTMYPLSVRAIFSWLYVVVLTLCPFVTLCGREQVSSSKEIFFSLLLIRIWSGLDPSLLETNKSAGIVPALTLQPSRSAYTSVLGVV